MFAEAVGKVKDVELIKLLANIHLKIYSFNGRNTNLLAPTRYTRYSDFTFGRIVLPYNLIVQKDSHRHNFYKSKTICMFCCQSPPKNMKDLV